MARQERADYVTVGARVAAAAADVVRRIDSPVAVAMALAAVVGGDLPPPPAPANDDDNDTRDGAAVGLLPLYPPGAASIPSPPAPPP